MLLEPMKEKDAPGRMLDAKMEKRAWAGRFAYTNGFPRVMGLTPRGDRSSK